MPWTYADYVDAGEEWPRRPATIREWPYCDDCGEYVQGLDPEDCVKKCHGPGYHTLGHNGQLWLPAVAEFTNERLRRLEEERKAAQQAAVRLGATPVEARQWI